MSHLRRQLQPYGFGDFHWALTHVLAFAGAFFCCLLVSAYVSEGAVTGLKGKPVWGVSLCLSRYANGCKWRLCVLTVWRWVLLLLSLPCFINHLLAVDMLHQSLQSFEKEAFASEAGLYLALLTGGSVEASH